MKSEIRQETKVTILAGFIAALVFAFDLALPLGVAGGVPYVAVVILGIWMPRWQWVIAFALLTSLLTVLGYFLSPQGGIEWVVLTNRGLALLIIWTAVILVMRQKRTELALRQSERLRLIIADAAPGSMIIARRSDGTILYANPAFAELVGVPMDSVEGRQMAEFYWDASERKAVLQIADENDKPAPFEFEMRNADAGKIVVENTVRALEFGGERVLLGNFVDVTARNEQAAQLRQSNAQLNRSLETFRSAIESMSGGFALWDANDKLVICNQQFREFYPSVAHMLVPGLEYETMVRASVENGEVLDAEGREEEWIQERLELHRNPLKPAVYKLATGRWIQSSEQRTAEGGTIGVRTDITDLQLAQEELRVSEARFRNLIEGSIQGILINDNDLKPMFANQAMADMFGYASPDEIMDLDSIEGIFAPEELPRILDYRDQRRGGGTAPDNYEVRGVTKNGQQIWLHLTVRSVQWQGKIATQATYIDITKRKLAEQALHESQAYLASVTENLPGTVYRRVLHVDGSISLPFMSSRSDEIFHRDSERTMHDPDYMLQSMLPEDLPKYMEAVRVSAENLTPLDIELRFPDEDGQIQWSHSISRPHKAENGDIVWDGIAFDVTARKQAEETQRRLVATFDGVDELVSIYDADDRLVYANQALLDFDHEIVEALRPGATFEARLRMALEKNPPLDAVGREEEWLEERMSKHGTSDASIEVSRRDGTTILSREHIMPDGSIAHVGSNITAHKAMEGQLHQAQKLEAVGQLTGGIAHDFNNLLAIIMGNLQLLEYAGGLTGANEEFLQEGLAAAKRGTDLTHRLLAFARNQPLRPQAVRVDEVISGLKEMLQRTLSEAIELRYDLHDGRAVMADMQQLENAILNLAINARDAMAQGDSLTFRTSDCRLDGSEFLPGQVVEPGEYCLIEISDTGTGMDAETLSKVFDPFFTTKEFGKGSGLGLSMVHGFAGQSNGHIAIDSTVGVGTTVRLYLPLITAEENIALPEEEAPDWPLGKGEVVLVLEDEEDLRRTTANLLEGLNYRACQARDAAEALTVLDSGEKVHLLFSDVVLPGGLSGPELADKARAKYPDLKVLYCSGYTDNMLTNGDGTKQDSQLLDKPYSLDELAVAVHAVLHE